MDMAPQRALDKTFRLHAPPSGDDVGIKSKSNHGLRKPISEKQKRDAGTDRLLRTTNSLVKKCSNFFSETYVELCTLKVDCPKSAGI